MGISKAHQIQIEARRLKVARLLLQGIVSPLEIARQLGGDESQRVTISRDVVAIREQWKKETIADYDAAKAEQAESLRFLYREALAAWERSKFERQSTRTKRKTSGQGGTDDEAEVRKEQRDGDPRFMEQARQALADIRAIYGLDEAKRHKHGADDNASPIQIHIVEIRPAVPLSLPNPTNGESLRN